MHNYSVYYTQYQFVVKDQCTFSGSTVHECALDIHFGFDFLTPGPTHRYRYTYMYELGEAHAQFEQFKELYIGHAHAYKQSIYRSKGPRHNYSQPHGSTPETGQCV